MMRVAARALVLAEVGVAVDEIMESAGAGGFLEEGVVMAMHQGEAFAGQREVGEVVVAVQLVEQGTGAEAGVVVLVVAEDEVEGRDTGEVIQHFRRHQVPGVKPGARVVEFEKRDGGDGRPGIVVRVG